MDLPIYSLMDFSRLAVVHCHSNLPYMGLAHGLILVNWGSTWARLCGSHISETVGWIYAIHSYMELSGPVVVQHYCHFIFTLEIQGQIWKILYRRNGRVDWHFIKGCELIECWTHVVTFNNNNNNGPNGHLFYAGGDLMMRRGMLPIIMLPDGDLRIVLHLVPFWILTIWGSVHIEETVVGWRSQLRMKTSVT